MSEGIELVDVKGVQIEVRRSGAGPAALYLHSHLGMWQMHPFLAALSRDFTVIAPSAPGFEGSPTVDRFTSIDDLSYLCLDLLETMELRDVTLVGASLGGWLALSIAVKDASRFKSIALIDPTGVHFGGPEDESIGDVFSMSEDEFTAKGFANPENGRKRYAEWTDAELLTSSRNREAAARYAWMPCLYDPKLRSWLHRVALPTLVLWGEADRITERSFADQMAIALPHASLTVVEGAGHFPAMEQPEATARLIADFALGVGADRASAA